jgi:hypothetical protein
VLNAARAASWANAHSRRPRGAWPLPRRPQCVLQNRVDPACPRGPTDLGRCRRRASRPGPNRNRAGLTPSQASELFDANRSLRSMPHLLSGDRVAIAQRSGLLGPVRRFHRAPLTRRREIRFVNPAGPQPGRFLADLCSVGPQRPQEQALGSVDRQTELKPAGRSSLTLVGCPAAAISGLGLGKALGPSIPSIAAHRPMPRSGM